jgi:hypothetical protein
VPRRGVRAAPGPACCVPAPAARRSPGDLSGCLVLHVVSLRPWRPVDLGLRLVVADGLGDERLDRFGICAEVGRRRSHGHPRRSPGAAGPGGDRDHTRCLRVVRN